MMKTRCGPDLDFVNIRPQIYEMPFTFFSFCNFWGKVHIISDQTEKVGRDIKMPRFEGRRAIFAQPG